MKFRYIIYFFLASLTISNIANSVEYNPKDYAFCSIWGDKKSIISFQKCKPGDDGQEISFKKFVRLYLFYRSPHQDITTTRMTDAELFSYNYKKLIGEFNAYNLDKQKIYQAILEMDEFQNYVNLTAKINKNFKIKNELRKKKFQPKETISDDESPIIDIASVITVNDQAYTLKGKIKDESGVYLTVDGRAVDLNKDEFEIERFSVNPDQQQKIKIVAIDEWNNKSEKTVTVKIDLSQNKVAKKYEDLKPNKIRRVKTDNNRIAIIIGIEKYQYLNNLDAKYANRDANAFRAYATRALGIPSSNVELLVDDKATRTQILKTFKNNLRRLAGKKGKDIHIFFAGHGLASDNGEDLYILPQDGESSLLEDTAISRVELIELIQQVNPNSVTMYFDTCYSGQTRDEQLLVASLRPVRIVADEKETPDNFTIFTASDYDQTSGSIEEAKHGMFSYYLMKGLEGNADLNTDNKITNGELIFYLKDNVSQEAFIQNRQQDPMFSGDPDKVLISYN
jgi:hypothetical protein